MSQPRPYSPPSLTEYGGVGALTGFTGSDSQQDIVFTPNGDFGFPGPSSEFACEIPNASADDCLPGDN